MDTARYPGAEPGGESKPIVMILGGPRSGTTWLGKIFDSHPRVLYRHEPDSTLSCTEFPFIVPQKDVAAYVEPARLYLQRLCDVRNLRTVGKLPIFGKRVAPGWRSWYRKTLITVLKGVDGAGFLSAVLERVSVPDVLSLENGESPVYVIKSVISSGRAGLYQRALPQASFVLIVRHPCGFVASQLRAGQNTKLHYEVPIKALSESEHAEKYGINSDDLRKMDLVEQLAWMWLLQNEKMLDDAAGNSRTTIVTHERISRDPLAEARRLFEFCGLDWDPQTESFVQTSSSHRGKTTYFGVRRDSAKEADKWRDELDDATVDRVLSITRESSAGRLFQ